MHASVRTSQETTCLVGLTTRTFAAATMPSPSEEASGLTSASRAGEASLEQGREQTWTFIKASWT